MASSRSCRCPVQRSIGLADVVGGSHYFIITATNFPYLVMQTESHRASPESDAPAMLNPNTYVHLGHVDADVHEALLTNTLKHEIEQAVRSYLEQTQRRYPISLVFDMSHLQQPH